MVLHGSQQLLFFFKQLIGAAGIHVACVYGMLFQALKIDQINTNLPTYRRTLITN